MRRLALASAILLAVSTAATAQSGPPPRVHNRTLSTVTDGGRQVFRLDAKPGDGVAWWPDAAFTTGTIELDIRGRNVPQASFVGVAFHGADATTYEAIYFRPFNFADRGPGPAPARRAVRLASGASLAGAARPAARRLREAGQPSAQSRWLVSRHDPRRRRHRHGVRRSGRHGGAHGAAPDDPPGGWVGLWVGNTSPGDFANVTIKSAGR